MRTRLPLMTSALNLILAAIFATVSVTTSLAANIGEWTEDIDTLVNKLVTTHPHPYYRMNEPEFRAQVIRLKERLGELSDGEVTLELMRLVGQVHDGHTSLHPENAAAFSAWFPWRTVRFPDGLFVTSLPTEHQELIGSRVLRIGGVSADSAFAATQELVGADNDFSARERAPYYLANASILHTLGIAESVDSLRVLLQTPDGVKRELTLPRIAGEIVNWWYFRQERGPRPQDCATLLSRFDADKPFHIDYRDRAYWFEVLPEQNTVYMQLSAVQDLGEETFAGFTRRLFDYIDNHAVGKLVIDIRYNGGGDGSMLWPFVYEIIKRDRINQRGRLFVITGPKTFSAATMAACHLANHTNALLVGEPVGAGMNHHGDAVGFTLPNSGYTLNVSTLYWQFGYPTDRRAYIPPDYPAVMTAAAYFAGRDPALEAILNGDATSVKDIALRDGVDAALAWYERAKAKFTDIDWWVPFTEREANSLGYELLELGNTADAVTIFTLNADAYPQSWNVWDSLGEAHLAAGHRADALRCYRKSLELNPGNGHAQMAVRNLESGR